MNTERNTGEYQREVSLMVQREVLCCLSVLISNLCAIAGNLGRDDAESADVDTLWDLQRREPDDDDRREALDSAGYVVTEDSEGSGDWYVIAKTDMDAMRIVSTACEVPTLFYAFNSRDIEDEGETALIENAEGSRDEDGARSEYIQTHGDSLSAYDESEALREACDQCRVEVDSREVYEHWAVSSWLAGQLEERGECVHEWQNLRIWSRCTTGQSIAMDGVICDIYDDLHKGD